MNFKIDGIAGQQAADFKKAANKAGTWDRFPSRQGEIVRRAIEKAGSDVAFATDDGGLLPKHTGWASKPANTGSVRINTPDYL